MDNFFANRAVINLFLVKIGLVGFDEGACCGFNLFDTRTRFAIVDGEAFKASKEAPVELMVFIVKVIFNQEVVKLESDVKVINSIVGTVVCGPSLGHDATLMTNIVIETFIDVIGSLASAKISGAEVGIFEMATGWEGEIILFNDGLFKDFVGRRKIGVENQVFVDDLQTVVA